MRQKRAQIFPWFTLIVVLVGLLPEIGCVPGGAQLFSTCDPPLPTITAISPLQVKAGSAEFVLQVTGKDFHSHSFLVINGQRRTTMVQGEHELTALIEPSDVAQPGTPQVSVFTPSSSGDCGGGPSNPVTLTVTP